MILYFCLDIIVYPKKREMLYMLCTMLRWPLRYRLSSIEYTSTLDARLSFTLLLAFTLLRNIHYTVKPEYNKWRRGLKWLLVNSIRKFFIHK